MKQPIFSDPAALAALCRRDRIRTLSLFGSTLGGTARPDSDADLLVAFEPDATPAKNSAKTVPVHSIHFSDPGALPLAHGQQF